MATKYVPYKGVFGGAESLTVTLNWFKDVAELRVLWFFDNGSQLDASWHAALEAGHVAASGNSVTVRSLRVGDTAAHSVWLYRNTISATKSAIADSGVAPIATMIQELDELHRRSDEGMVEDNKSLRVPEWEGCQTHFPPKEVRAGRVAGFDTEGNPAVGGAIPEVREIYEARDEAVKAAKDANESANDAQESADDAKESANDAQESENTVTKVFNDFKAYFANNEFPEITGDHSVLAVIEMEWEDFSQLTEKDEGAYYLVRNAPNEVELHNAAEDAHAELLAALKAELVEKINTCATTDALAEILAGYVTSPRLGEVLLDYVLKTQVATTDALGLVKIGGKGVGLNNNNQLALNVRKSHSGFEFDGTGAFINVAEQNAHPQAGTVAPTATDTNGKIVVLNATTTLPGGVKLATGVDDTGDVAVLTAAQVKAAIEALEARLAALEAMEA